MNFFEQELKKIIGPRRPDATYVGRACYVQLSDMSRAKIRFIASHISSHYDTLRISILNRNEGEVDSIALNLWEVLGKKQVSNPCFREGLYPYIWQDGNKPDWYVYRPTAQDYAAMRREVDEYLSVFQELAPTQQFQQTM